MSGCTHVSSATDRQKRDGMCWWKTGRRLVLYNDARRFQDHRPRRSGSGRHPHRRQLLWLFQEIVKCTQVALRAHLTGYRRGRCIAGGPCFAQLRPRGGFPSERCTSEEGYTFAGLSRSGREPTIGMCTGRLRHRDKVFPRKIIYIRGERALI